MPIARAGKPLTNQLRIIGGQWRSRIIRFPDAESLRPTPERVRETLFNWLGQDVSGFDVLDLFAGSGALAFESLSRGAALAVAVDNDPKVIRCLADNARLLGAADRLEIQRGDAMAFLARETRRFDLIAELGELLPVSVRPEQVMGEIAAIPISHRGHDVFAIARSFELDLCDSWKVFA